MAYVCVCLRGLFITSVKGLDGPGLTVWQNQTLQAWEPWLVMAAFGPGTSLASFGVQSPGAWRRAGFLTVCKASCFLGRQMVLSVVKIGRTITKQFGRSWKGTVKFFTLRSALRSAFTLWKACRACVILSREGGGSLLSEYHLCCLWPPAVELNIPWVRWCRCLFILTLHSLLWKVRSRLTGPVRIS